MPGTTLRLGRLGAIAGLIFMTATIAGNAMADSGDAAGSSAAVALANFRRTHGLLNHLGTAIEIAGFIAFMFFAGYLYRVLRGSERRDDWLAAPVLITAAADVSVKLGSGAALAAAQFHPAALTPALAQVLVDLNNGAFVITGLTMAGFLLAVSAGGYRSRVLPRTLVWIGIVLGALGLVTPTPGLSDPVNYNPLPYLMSLLWIAAVSVTRIVRETSARRAVETREGAALVGT